MGTTGGFEIGDRVEKVSGYRWPGVVVSVFKTRAGETRVVVECTAPEVAGALHVYNPDQLKLAGACVVTRTWHYSQAQWRSLPSPMKKRWWDETDYGSHPPSTELSAEIRALLEAM
jgi:hypothetical protein